MNWPFRRSCTEEDRVTPLFPTGPADLLPVGQATFVGTVSAFDDRRGVGVVRCADRSVAFHCTAITDGTRTIEAGALVAVRIGPARLGRYEARSVHPLPVADIPDVEREVGDVREVDAVVHDETAVDDSGTGSPGHDADPTGYVPRTSVLGSVAPAPTSPFAPIPVEVPVPESAPGPKFRSGSGPSAWSPEGAITPASGTPAATGAPASGTGRGAGPVRADEAVGGDIGDDEASPRPNFWSPFSTAPAGPPPTWSTPVTPKEPPADGS